MSRRTKRLKERYRLPHSRCRSHDLHLVPVRLEVVEPELGRGLSDSHDAASQGDLQSPSAHRLASPALRLYNPAEAPMTVSPAWSP